MQKLKQVIESTLINNLEFGTYADGGGYIDLESIQTCSDYITKDFEEAMFEFGNAVEDMLLSGQTITSMKELFNQFIEDRYKDK